MTATDLRTVPWPPPPAPVHRDHDQAHRHRHTTQMHTVVARGASRAPVTPPTPVTSHVLTLMPIRVFLAVGWVRAGVEKLVDRHWWNGDRLRGFVDTNRSLAIPPFRVFMDHVAVPFALIVSFVVLATEIACGLAIGVGHGLRTALRWGVALNIVFVLSGPVNPSAFYLVMEIVLLFAIAEGTIDVRPSRPSHRTLILAGILLVSAGVLAPYVRTLEPAKVIADPALMLLFLALLTAAILVTRFALAQPPALPRESGGAWVRRVTRWATASSGQPAADTNPPPPATMPHLVSAIGWKQFD